jgi:cell division protein FtsW (lipid II flippase)
VSKNTPARQQRREKRESRRETLIVLALMIPAVIAVFYLRFPDKWLTAAASVIVTFVVMTMYFHRRWKMPRFWIAMGAALALDLIATWFIFRFTLRAYNDVPWLAIYPICFIAGGLIYKLVNLTTSAHSLNTPEVPR